MPHANELIGIFVDDFVSSRRAVIIAGEHERNSHINTFDRLDVIVLVHESRRGPGYIERRSAMRWSETTARDAPLLKEQGNGDESSVDTPS